MHRTTISKRWLTAGVLAAVGAVFTAVVALSVLAPANSATANGCGKSATSNYSGLELDDETQSTVGCDGKKTEGKPTKSVTTPPKQTSTPTPSKTTTKPKPSKTQDKPSPRPSQVSDPRPKPTVNVVTKPTPVVTPDPVVHTDPPRQNALPPGKLSATATKVCVVKVKITNSGGSAETATVGKTKVTIPAKQTRTVEVPVAPDGTWKVAVTSRSYKRTFTGGCDCAKPAAGAVALNAAAVKQDAVPQVEWKFPWLVVAGFSALTGLGGLWGGARAATKRAARNVTP